MKINKNKLYKFKCGHNNGGIINVYPFKTWICFDCGFQTDILIEVTK